MKKIVRIILVAVLAVSTLMTFSAIASAESTAETFSKMYVGEYESGNFSGMAHIVFGKVSDMESKYGIVVKDVETNEARAYEGKIIGADGKFAIAIYGMPVGKYYTAKVYSGDVESGIFGEEVPFQSGKSPYTVAFLIDGTEYESTGVSHGELASAPSIDPEKDGYVFDGWDYDFTLPVTGDLQINAKWLCEEHEWDKGVYVSSIMSTTFTCVNCPHTKTELGLANIDPELTLVGDEPSEDSDEYGYYRYKLTIDKSQEVRYIFRQEEKEYYGEGEYNKVDPENGADFKYIGTLLPKDVYEADYKFEVEQKPYVNFGKGEFNASNMNYKFYNFMRFVYISTGGELELAFEYDTSFIYASSNLTFVVRGRFIVDSVKPGLTTKNDLASFLTQNYVNTYDYIEFYEYYSKINFKTVFLDTTDETAGLQVGDYAWCDVCVEIPLTGLEQEFAFWSYLLANTEEGQDDGMYRY